jgi:putative membrane protein
MRFLMRLLINAAALWVAVKIVPGITYTGEWLPFLGVALVFGLVNAFIRPIVKLLTLPILFLTLGLFALVVNGMMLMLTSWLSNQLALNFQVTGCWTAILGALVVSIVRARRAARSGRNASSGARHAQAPSGSDGVFMRACPPRPRTSWSGTIARSATEA